MGSLRTPGSGETVASDTQPSGLHNVGETVQNIGTMIWNGSGWVPAYDGRQGHEQASGVPAAGNLSWSYEGGFWVLNPTADSDERTSGRVPQTANGLLNQSGRIDRQRNNQYGVVALASEARTATATSALITNYNHSKLFIRLIVTNNPGGGKTLQVSFIAGNTQVLFVPTAVSLAYQIAPGLENAVNGGPATEHPTVQAQTANSTVPGNFELRVIPSDSSSWTYELTYGLLV